MARHIRIAAAPEAGRIPVPAAASRVPVKTTGADYRTAITRPYWLLATLIVLLPLATFLLALTGPISIGFLVGLAMMATVSGCFCLAMSARQQAEARTTPGHQRPSVARHAYQRIAPPIREGRHLRVRERELRPSARGAGLP